MEHLRNPGSFDGLQEAADILTDMLLSHLAYEEAQLVEPLAATAAMAASSESRPGARQGMMAR